MGYAETDPSRDLEDPVGGKVKDYGFGPDRSGGRLGIRLYVGRGRTGLHHASPPLTRRDVWALRLSTRGRAAIPERVDPWWVSLSEEDRSEVEQLLAALSWLAWLSAWWHADKTSDAQDPDESQIDATPDDLHPD